MISGFLSIYLSLKNKTNLETSTQLRATNGDVLVSRFHTMIQHELCSWAASLRMARQPWPAICGMPSDISYVYFMMFELKMYYIIYIYISLYDILYIYMICHIQCILDILLSTPGHKLIIDMNIPLSNHFTIHPPGDNNHALHGQC